MLFIVPLQAKVDGKIRVVGSCAVMSNGTLKPSVTIDYVFVLEQMKPSNRIHTMWVNGKIKDAFVSVPIKTPKEKPNE